METAPKERTIERVFFLGYFENATARPVEYATASAFPVVRLRRTAGSFKRDLWGEDWWEVKSHDRKLHFLCSKA
jgi:hypothetical protein